MLDIDLIRREPEKIKKGIAAKNVNPQLVDQFLELDQKWRRMTETTENLRAKLNKLSKERKIEEAKAIKEKVKAAEAELTDLEKNRLAVLKSLPNLPLSEAPVGKDEKNNKVLREVGKKPKRDFTPQDYLTINEKLNLIDTERAAWVSGSRFGYLKNEAALLEFALVRLAFDFLIDPKNTRGQPFIPVIPPILIKPEAMEGMGYTERGREEIYFIEKDNLFLAGTSEQSVGPMHRNEIFYETDLPTRYVAFSTCFRREAGSYGKDTKGILRVHQFDKVEMFSITAPETSADEHEFLLEMEEALMQKLDLPYRVLQICTGDLGDPAAAKYDIEAWLPGQNGGQGEFRETHSASNTTDYQARRLNIKFKTKDQKLHYVHMLNGTAFAIGRMIIAILENYQTRKETVKIPKALQKYIGLKEISR
jgi:seryl-tRNA synthetase